MLVAVLVRAHPSPAVAPLPSSGCEALITSGSMDSAFFSYHVHVLFNDTTGSGGRGTALALQARFAQAFGVSAGVDPVTCDDSNTTHGLSPGLCMIDNDWGKTDYPTGLVTPRSK